MSTLRQLEGNRRSGADDDLPLVNSTPAPAAEPATPGFDPSSLSTSPQTTFTPKWLRLGDPHRRPTRTRVPYDSRHAIMNV